MRILQSQGTLWFFDLFMDVDICDVHSRSFTLTTGPIDNEATGTEVCAQATEVWMCTNLPDRMTKRPSQSKNASDKMDVNKGECADIEQPVDSEQSVDKRDSSGCTESGDKDNEVDEEVVHSADDIRKEL